MSISRFREKEFSKLLPYLNEILKKFSGCFTRQKAFSWFVIIVLGLVVRYDVAGISSIVRAFSLNALAYAGIKHFFRSSSYELGALNDAWIGIAGSLAPKLQLGGRIVLVEDGHQRPVEGSRMPGTKKLKSSSNNSGKPESFFGNFFGSIGVLVKGVGSVFCLPLVFSIQKGNEVLDGWQDKRHWEHSEQVLKDAFHIASIIGCCTVVLDRYFISEKLLTLYDKLCFYSRNFNMLNLVMRCKISTVGYEFPRMKNGKKSKAKAGTKVKLKLLFEHKTFFKKTCVRLYGKMEDVHYCSKVLLWKKSYYRKLRFVLAEYGNHRIILATTDLQADPVDVIKAYSYRFKIEHMFKSFTNTFGGTFYHFWTKPIEKLNRYADEDANNLKSVKSEKRRGKILKAYRCVHVFVLCACIAQGIVQLLCLKFSEIDPASICFQCTYKQNGLSEGMMKRYLQQNLLSFALESPNLEISQVILGARNRYLLKI